MEDPITIGDKQYKFADLSPTAQKMLNFIKTIDNNLNSLDTQMEMMKITREGCYIRLTTELPHVTPEEEIPKPAA